MKRNLSLLAGTVTFIAPIMFWSYLSVLACAFITNASNCGPFLGGFWDIKFLQIAALPWVISLDCFWGAKKLNTRKQA